jgi:hypothetical protein
MPEKEIWKLLELLNEYEKEITQVNYTPECWTATTRGNLSYLSYSTLYSDLLLISKNYWFIQRLVEQDKIGREQFYDKARNIITDFDLRWEYEWACNEIIMLLSISDEPIELLCQILK